MFCVCMYKYIQFVIYKLHINQNCSSYKNKKEFKHNMKDSHLITREQKKEQKRPIKTTSNNKMVIRTYIINSYLKCNWIKCFKQKTQTSRMDIKTNTCCLQEIHFRSRDIQTESERMEKDIPCKEKSKERQSSNTHIRQKRL